MYQMASPVTEWGAPGAFTRRLEGKARTTPGGRTSCKTTTEGGGHDIVAKRQQNATNASNVSKGTMWGTV